MGLILNNLSKESSSINQGLIEERSSNDVDLKVNDEIIKKIKSIDLNSITPFEALIKLNELIDDIK